MPNGGTDNCHACWFNLRNKGFSGHGHPHENDPEPSFCRLRATPALSPAYVYCLNHCRSEETALDVAIGPRNESRYPDRIPVLHAPDSAEARRRLLEYLEAIPHGPSPASHSPIPVDEVVVWQLGEFREQRAIDGLNKVLSFQSSTAHEEDHRDWKSLKAAAHAALKLIRDDPHGIVEGKTLPRPLLESYWVIPGRFLAGEYPGAKSPEAARARLQAMLDSQVNYFVDLTSPSDGLEPYEELLWSLNGSMWTRYRRFPIEDLTAPSEDEMAAILDDIDEALARGHTVYVHCWGGAGRTGAVIGCFLVRRGLSDDAALARLRELWASIPKSKRLRSPQTPSQLHRVRAWEAERRGVPVTLPATFDALRSRYHGALLGLATGDAVGTTVEFKSPGSFPPVSDMVGGGPFHLAPGEWTDDTSMTLCLAASLVELQMFDPHDQMRRYMMWYRNGYMSSRGTCFDIGATTREALERYERDFTNPFAGSSSPQTAGNGSLMRVAPVALQFLRRPAVAVELAGDSSRTTHGAKAAVDACRYFTALMIGALRGESKETFLAPLYAPVPETWRAVPLCDEIAEVARGSFKSRTPPEIVGSGYVVRSLEAALWAFSTTSTFRDGCLAAVNLGDDADTTAAIYGALAGAFYGAEAIPVEWRQRLAMRGSIEVLAESLLLGARWA